MKFELKKPVSSDSKGNKDNTGLIMLICILVFLILEQITVLLDVETTPNLLVNYLITLPVFGIALTAIRRFTPALAAASMFIFFLYYLDEYVFYSRYTHIHFNDVYCIKDALSVSGNYPLCFSLEILLKLLLNIGVCTILIILEIKTCPESFNKMKKKKALLGGLITVLPVAVLVVFTLIGVIKINSPDFMMNNYTTRHGLFYSLYSEAVQSHLKKPEGYSKEETERILSAYLSDNDAVNSSDDPAHVIVIMNEALTDYSLLGKTNFKSDPLKEIHNLDGNTASGKMAVSVYGGYTSNTEFEFLTGIPTALLPSGYVPYLQCINGSTQSIASELTEIGYATGGIHPYFGQEYRRSEVYKFLGLQNNTFGKDFSTEEGKEVIGDLTLMGNNKNNFGSDLEYVRGFISDRECYNKILENVDDNIENGKKSFIFAVTIQNHGGYSYEGDDFKSEDYIDGSPEINQYLTCSSISSKAFAELTEKLKKYPEKVIVLMFGDHQPSISGVLNKIEPYSAETNNQYLKIADKYTVPYVMWANYDTEWALDSDEIVSPNYISAMLKQSAGLPLNEWDKFRLDAYSHFPAITRHYAVDSSGEFISKDDAMNSEIIRKYNYLAYRRLFDKD